MITGSLVLVASLLLSPALFAQVTIPVVPEPVTLFADEARDWGVAPTTQPRQRPYHAPTPLLLPGGRVINTLELRALLDANKDVLVIDVLDGNTRNTMAGAVWMPGVGSGRMFRGERHRFA